MQSRGFDRFVAIDWSGARALRTRAISVAEIPHDGGGPRLVSGPLKGQWSRAAVADWLLTSAISDARTLVGIDANFSYAAAIIAQQLPDATSAIDLWAQIDALAGEAPNFSGEIVWQHADMARFFWHRGARPPGFHGATRLAETACAAAGHGHPESPFKLIGPKQVGKGGLAVMRLCHHLRQTLGSRLAVWPFDAPGRIAGASLVLTEIYPRLFLRRAGLGSAKIRLTQHLDAALSAFDATAESAEITDHDADALVAAAGMRHMMQGADLPVPPTDLEDRIRREGWILGVAFPPGDL